MSGAFRKQFGAMAYNKGQSIPDHDVNRVGGSEGICLEQRARRFGYVHQDVSGQLAPSEGPTSSATCIRRGYFNPRHGEAPDNLATIVNVEDVVKRVRRAGVLPVKVSDDAGLFLCEFVGFLLCLSFRMSIKMNTNICRSITPA